MPMRLKQPDSDAQQYTNGSDVLQIFCQEEVEAVARLCIQHDVIAVCDEVRNLGKGDAQESDRLQRQVRSKACLEHALPCIPV